ncbi:MAG TPA: serine--tRNA ligase, partial [Planctomycetaceae bacterium]|nr:serine--tRNA ligase [Planctomycetaceae bacterium]
MLDLQFVCEHQALVEENCRNRGVRVDVARVVELAGQRRQLIVEGDKHRHEQKEIAAQIPKIADKAQRQALVDNGKELKTLVAENETALKALESQLRELEMQIPNLTHPDAPVGTGDQANLTIRTWGEKKAFDFKPRDHVELMERLDLVDLEAGTRVAGHGFYFLKNEAVLLELGLVQLALEKLRAAG